MKHTPRFIVILAALALVTCKKENPPAPQHTAPHTSVSLTGTWLKDYCRSIVITDHVTTWDQTYPYSPADSIFFSSDSLAIEYSNFSTDTGYYKMIGNRMYTRAAGNPYQHFLYCSIVGNHLYLYSHDTMTSTTTPFQTTSIDSTALHKLH
jgi:hypothetical protein